jgi:hypothetical protein
VVREQSYRATYRELRQGAEVRVMREMAAAEPASV